MYIEYLLLHAQFERVASLAPSIFSRDKEGWQELIDRFYHAGYLLLLADSLPFADPNGESWFSSKILVEYVNVNSTVF